MTLEQRVARYVVDAKYSDLDPKTVKTVKRQLLAAFGGLIAGWNSLFI